MTPKEKANDLFDKFLRSYYNDQNAKQCASIAIDEIFGVYKRLSEDDDIMFPYEIKYWEQVKQEIDKL